MSTGIVFSPIDITEEHIVSGPPSAEAQVYDAGTTYATDDEVWYGGNAWRSLVDSNLGNTPVEGANWTDLGEVDKGALAWAAGTYADEVYAIKDHRIWRSTKPSNTSTPGATDETATDWQDYGPVNRHRPFDKHLNRFALLKGKLKYVIDMPSRATQGFALFPIGGTLSITKEADSEVIYSQSESLVRDSGGYFYNYFNAPIETKSLVIFQDMRSAPTERITVTITGAEDAQVGVAQLAFGYGYEMGRIIAPADIGLSGFVRITFDDFGNPVSPERPKQTTVNFTVSLPSLDNARLLSTLAPMVQRPVGAFMRDGGPFGLVAYGFLDDVLLTNPRRPISNTNIKVIGFQQ